VPLYEYSCRTCAHTFEALVRSYDPPSCPSCGATDVERLLSLFAVDSHTTRDAARQKSMPKSVRQQHEKERGEFENWKRHHQ
jgi:putative FmdB family regulatory protein